MKREPSLARSLMFSLTGALIAFWLIAIGIGVQVMREEYDEVFDSALQETGDRIMAIVSAETTLRERTETVFPLELNNAFRSAYLTYQVRTPDGAVLLKSPNAQETPFEAPLSQGFYDTPRYRIYTAENNEHNLYLQITDRFSHRREAVRESAAAMLIPLLILIPASFGVIWLIVGRATRSIGILRHAIAEKDSGNLAPIAIADVPREFKTIVHSVNLLLDRLRLALDAEREFTTNSAHELRTPIAGAFAQCQLLIRELPEGAAKNRALSLETALATLGKLAEKLLQLSRADSGIGTKEQSIDLLGVLDLLVRDFEHIQNSSSHIVYHEAADKTLERPVDADAFAIVMRNIIENALKHRASGTPVVISIDDDNVIVVSNDCPLIPADELGILKKRFTRGKTNAEGSGLGLSIAEKIVTQMGGTLELRSPASGKDTGFEARITL